MCVRAFSLSLFFHCKMALCEPLKHGRLIYVAGGSYFDRLYQFFEQIMTATVETVSEQLDLTAIMPTEKVMAVARAVTLSETDVGKKEIRLTLSLVFLRSVKRG